MCVTGTYVKKLPFVCLCVRRFPYKCVHLRQEHTGTEVDILKIYGAIRIVVIYLEYHRVCEVKSHDGCRGLFQFLVRKIKIKSTSY